MQSLIMAHKFACRGVRGENYHSINDVMSNRHLSCNSFAYDAEAFPKYGNLIPGRHPSLANVDKIFSSLPIFIQLGQRVAPCAG